MKAMDFDDLSLNWQRLLAEIPIAAEALQRRFATILVDEYQDTNLSQGNIIDRTALQHHNVLVVGDDAQGIYGFRGAHFENILKFPERYPECRRLQLTRNHRSTPPILSLADAAIAHNKKQFEKRLVPRSWPSACSNCARRASRWTSWMCSRPRR